MAEVLRMPEVAANTTEAIVSAWLVDLNSPFTAGDTLVTIETEKAVVDVEAEADGVLLRHLVDAGTSVEVGSPIAVLGTGAEHGLDLEGLLTTLGLAPAAKTPPTKQSFPAPTSGRVFASPLARRMAKEHALDLTMVTGSGPGGRIRRSDIDAALRPAVAAPAALPAQPQTPLAAVNGEAKYHDVPVSRMRAAIASRLSESKQTAPHFYLRGTARVDRLLALRKELNEHTAVRVSVTDLLIKAVGRAHTLVPAMNVQWTGDSIRHFTDADVAVAVATESGLVTPVLHSADSKSLHQIVAGTQDLIARAKERRLQQSELEGGTISITNLGMFGTEEFAAILNPPQAAILAVGAARQEPVVESGELTVGSVLRLTLSVDHRPVDGATAAEWMRTFIGLLENPVQILM